ncbi:uncharacterized protein F5147DRAFT_655550 [Suillus discolor]|uniref:Uncharacterized protein n=1 Tax=Suillus discolor TaxID=1912936 RepID=A0A9P7F1P4_9AGAM|nr:uncharacterized protein F5147DRAFT_655550 [Suillus discolor]KAG2100432.1 hypothetical protein F5147DRAFT_655550 [Suillus discolor]
MEEPFEPLPELHHHLFLSDHSGDPAVKDFVPKLKNHLLSHILGFKYDGNECQFSDSERNNLCFINNLSRDQDSMWPGHNCTVMTLAREEGEHTHLFWCYIQGHKLKTVPLKLWRFSSCHLIPAFAEGRSDALLSRGNLYLMLDLLGEYDWRTSLYDEDDDLQYLEDNLGRKKLISHFSNCFAGSHASTASSHLKAMDINSMSFIRSTLNMMDIDRDSENTMDIIYQAKDDHLKGDNESLMDVNNTQIGQDNEDLMDINNTTGQDNESLMDVDSNNTQIDQEVGDNEDPMDVDDIQTVYCCHECRQHLHEFYQTMIYKNSPLV